MGQIAALGAVLSAALGAACCVRGRRLDFLVVTTMLVMVVAMIDTMLLGSTLLAPLTWAGLLSCGAATVALLRRRHALGLERAAHLGTMALFSCAMGLIGSHSDGAHAGEPGSHMAAMMNASAAAHVGLADELLPMAVALLACGLAGLQLARGVTCAGATCAERVAGAISLLVMAALTLLG